MHIPSSSVVRLGRMAKLLQLEAASYSLSLMSTGRPKRFRTGHGGNHRLSGDGII